MKYPFLYFVTCNQNSFKMALSPGIVCVCACLPACMPERGRDAWQCCSSTEWFVGCTEIQAVLCCRSKSWTREA
ncbi:hypothetical protein SKAU_G00254700 [Synaphobranchus kaupii]|uniref:Uncharacterized protein n=1 Tax=Synaphobranchus kaupii TaxID=118154 RepID=A0A9Q1F3I9_SYNKA|nr:hypothetical protein SKAU_G00254700 [Synaphobranchus kaupii]